MKDKGNLLKDDVEPEEARKLQAQFKQEVKLEPCEIPSTITGVDISYDTERPETGVASAVTIELPSLKILEKTIHFGKTNFPYIPGLLGFREVNMISKAIQGLGNEPEVIVYDGHGIAHPSRFGAASQLGVALDIATIGCAKKLFVGTIDGILHEQQFSRANLILHGEIVGIAMRMADGVKPVFLSPGHLIDIDSTIKIIKTCSNGFRVPEPTRQADIHSRAKLIEIMGAKKIKGK